MKELQPSLHSRFSRIPAWIPWACAGVLLLIFMGQVWVSIRVHSNTYDEIAHIGAGITYVKTGLHLFEIREHPPLLKILVGFFLQWARPDFSYPLEVVKTAHPYRLGIDFLYRNTVTPELLLSLARLPSLLLGTFCAALVFLWSRRWFGWAGGFLSLVAVTCEPNMIAHASLATPDMGLTAFLLATLYFFSLWMETETPRHLVLSAVMAGCATCYKLPAAVVFLWILILVFAASPRPRTGRDLKSLGKWALVFLGCVTGVVLLIYRITDIQEFFLMLSYRVQLMFTHKFAPSVNFFHGKDPGTSAWYYFFVCLLLKTPLPFLILLGISFWNLEGKQKKWFLILPIVTFFLFGSFSNIQRGVRYILPVFPFMAVGIGAAAKLTDRKWRLVLGGLALWMGLEIALVAPHYLSYFNQLAGGPPNGYRWLLDSNLDWGQDYAKLREFLKEEGSPEIVVACFGTGDRHYYLGPNRQDLFSGSPENVDLDYKHVNSLSPKKEFLVVSATYVWGFFPYRAFHPEHFAWFREQRPYARLGNNIFVYDITRDARAHVEIAKIYRTFGQKRFYEREVKRALMINKEIKNTKIK